MKLRVAHRPTAALTLAEVYVVVFIVAVLVALVFVALRPAVKKTKRLNCVNLLKQVGLAYRIWSGDHNDKFPMNVSVTNGGSMELANAGDAASTFSLMSNELSSPKILVCFFDTNRIPAFAFDRGLNNSNISYFVGLDASEDVPQTILSGDDNFAIGGVAVKSGLQKFSTNNPVAWTTARHHFVGNIGLADGSVWQENNSGLTNLFNQTGLATNRLAIP